MQFMVFFLKLRYRIWISFCWVAKISIFFFLGGGGVLGIPDIFFFCEG